MLLICLSIPKNVCLLSKLFVAMEHQSERALYLGRRHRCDQVNNSKMKDDK